MTGRPCTDLGRCSSTGKVMHTTRRLARQTAHRRHPGEHMAVWRCRTCDHFHIGHARQMLLAELIAQALLLSPGGVVARKDLRAVAETAIGTDRFHRHSLLAHHLLRCEIADFARAGAVERTNHEVRLINPSLLTGCVEAARERVDRHRKAIEGDVA